MKAFNFQRSVYTQFLERVEKDKVTVKFQDIDDTNALMRRAGAFDDEGNVLLTKQEVGELLDVDAVIAGSMTLSKPMGTGTAVPVPIGFDSVILPAMTASTSSNSPTSCFVSRTLPSSSNAPARLMRALVSSIS